MEFLTNLRARVADYIAPELKERRNLAERQANTDPLTSLPNLRAFQLGLDTAERSDLMVIILFDLNNFGLANKLYNWQFGNDLLKDFTCKSKQVMSLFSPTNRMFRIGGDEFAVLARKDEALRLRDAIESRFGIVNIVQGSLIYMVSVSGVIGNTLTDADLRLQKRKADRKSQQETTLMIG